jgi:hypothetical protein
VGRERKGRRHGRRGQGREQKAEGRKQMAPYPEIVNFFKAEELRSAKRQAFAALSLLPSAYCLLPSGSWLLPTAHCSLLTR